MNKLKKLRKVKVKKKVMVAGAVLLLVIAGVIVWRVQSGNKVKAQSAGIPIMSATATMGSISTTVEATGTLANNSSEDIQIPEGIKIDEVKVEEGDSVKKGDTLATLDKNSVKAAFYEAKEAIEDIDDSIDDADSGTAEYYQLKEQRTELKETYTALKKLKETYKITATADGIITAVNVSAGSTSESSSSGTSSSSSSSSSGSLSGSGSGVTPTNVQGSSSGTASSVVQSGGIILTSTSLNIQVVAASGSEESSTEESSAEETTDTTDTEITSLTSLKITAPVTGAAPTDTIKSTTKYTGTITWSPSVTTFKANKAYTAKVVLIAADGYVFSSDMTPSITGAVISTYTVSSEGKTLTFKVVFEKTEAEETTEETTKKQPETTQAQQPETTQVQQPETTQVQQPETTQSGTQETQVTSGNNNFDSNNGTSGNNTGNNVSGGTGTTDESTASLDKIVSANESTSAATSDSTTQTSTSTSTSSSSSSTTTNSDFMTAFSYTAGDNMLVTVSVDEMDILSISKGQKVTLTLDAIEDEEFEGEITGIDTTGTSSGGTTKYSIEVTVPKSDSMLSGMNASASIIIEEKSDILLVPALAITEEGNTSYVYTEKDDSSGELSGKVEVETGSSDGTNVEVTSGLAENDTIYYTVVNSNDSSTSSDNKSNMMGGYGNRGSNSGGGMPSGGFSGGAPSGMKGGN